MQKRWFYFFAQITGVFCFILQISLAITGMNAVCPVFFKLISLIEQYHPRVALYWELTRYFAFHIAFAPIKASPLSLK